MHTPILSSAGNRRISLFPTLALAVAGLVCLATPPSVFAASITFTSVGAEDGYVLESGENSNAGGTVNAGGTSGQGLRAGDDASDKQYKTFVSFDTSSIPDGATITSAQLRLRRGTVFGNNPFGVLGVCRVDIKTGGFGGAVALAAGDWQATADATQVGTLDDAPANDDWSEGTLNATGLTKINRTGKTQFRVYFATGDNDDGANDYMGWYSGAHATAANWPQLVVTYSTDTTPPTVSITAPADGATVSGTTVSVTANASDNVGVVGVQFKLDGANLGSEDTGSPFGITWDSTTASNNTHVLTAVARDAAGNTTTSNGIVVTVNNLGPRNIHWEMDLESGQLQANTSLQDGIGAKTQRVNGPTKSITNITKANPGVVTSNNHGYANGTGVTITGVNGMTQLNGRLFRVKNKTTNTFQLWEDQAPGQPNPDPNHALGTLQVNTTGYGTYTSGGTLMSWVEEITNAGGAGPGSNLDVRVEQNESVGGTLVQPRKGSYFLRSAIHFHKDYSVFSGNSNTNKPRWNGTCPAAMDFDYDKEVWFGFSIFVPSNFEDETARKGAQGENQLVDISEDAGPSGGGFAILCVAVPGGFANLGGITGDTSHWIVKEAHSATSTTQLPPEGYRCYDLGEVAADKGKWTDFVIRARINPFSVPTNPSTIQGGKTGMGTLTANKGILQIWKSTGAVDGNGNRTMVLTQANRVNEPVGMVPREGFLVGTSVRQYKYGWHHHNTSVTGPVWMGYDEFRFGETVRDGTGYSDVHPSQLPMP